jgi:hypothetical protein
MRGAPVHTVWRRPLCVALLTAALFDAAGIARAAPPPIDLPQVPSVPQAPQAPQLTSPPVAPHAPAAPPTAPSVPALPPLGAGTAVTGGNGASPPSGVAGTTRIPGSPAGIGIDMGGGAPHRDDASPGGEGERRAAHASRRAYEQQLRTTVRRRRGCLGALGTLQRDVLILRGGIRGRAQSRTATARRLKVSRARVKRAERTGLRSLLRLCGGGRSATAVVLARASSTRGSGASLGILAGVSTRGSDQLPDLARGAVAGARASSGGSGSMAAGGDSTRKRGAGPLSSLGDPARGDFVRLVLLGALVVAGLGGLDLLFRRRGMWLAKRRRSRGERRD